MDLEDYGEMLEAKEDEWIGVLQKRRMELEQEDFKEQVSDCDIEREKIDVLEKKLADIRAIRGKLNSSEETAKADLIKELEGRVEEFECDFQEVIYHDDDNTEPKE